MFLFFRVISLAFFLSIVVISVHSLSIIVSFVRLVGGVVAYSLHEDNKRKIYLFFFLE